MRLRPATLFAWFFRTLLPLATALLVGLVTARPVQAQTLTVAVDSSLAGAVAEIARDFEATQTGLKLTLTSAAAGDLLEKIARGLKADVLISADIDTLARGSSRRLLVAEPPRVVALNDIVVVESSSRRVSLRDLDELAAPGVLRIAIGRLSRVPAGRDARAAIDVRRRWPALQSKMLVTNNVAEVLAAVASGAADAGFVYRTDAAGVAGVRVAFAPESPMPVQHAAALVAGSAQETLARQFLLALGADPARAVFKRLGFALPP